MINLFFTGKSDNYKKAKEKLEVVKKGFESFVIAFPDVTPDEIILIKNAWETLPKKIAKGVDIMALNFKTGAKSLLTKYNDDSYIKPHAHKIEYEIGKVIKGSVENLLTGVRYNEGDTYTFSPGEIHYLYSEEGCVVYSVLSLKSKHNFKPLPKKILNSL